MRNLTWEKVLATVVLFVSLLVMVVSVFMILLSLRLNEPIKTGINNTFQPINTSIEAVTPILTDTNTKVGELSTRLEDLESKLRESAEKDTGEDTPLVDVISNLQKEITERITALQSNITKAKENHPKLIAAIALAKNLPIFTPESPDQNRLDQASERAAGLKRDIEEFKTNIAQANAAEIASNVRKDSLTKAADRVEKVNSRLDQAEEAFDFYTAQVNSIQTLQANLLFAVDASTAATTILLIGLILAQWYPIDRTWEILKKPVSKKK